MKRKTREEKGITLVALIITIIVLLILAVVTISSVTGDGIIAHAKNAQTQYEDAQTEEKGVLSYYEQYLVSEGNTGDWIQDKTKVKNVKTGQEIEVGDIISNYQKTDGTKYKDSDNNNIEWAVLGVENGNVLLVSTSNVTTKKLEGKEVYLNGFTYLNDVTAGYDDGIGAVVNSARSINVEDINRVTGYNPLKTGTGEIFYIKDYGKVTQYLNKITFTLGEDTNDADGDGDITEDRIYYTSEIEPETTSGVSQYQKFENINGTVLVKENEYTGAEGTAKSITIENKYYSYNPTSLTNASSNATENGISEDSMAYDLLFAGTEEESNYYWLGSSYMYVRDGYAIFGVRAVHNGCVAGGTLWKSYNGKSLYLLSGVRAVISLRSDVQFTRSGEHVYNISVAN